MKAGVVIVTSVHERPSSVETKLNALAAGAGLSLDDCAIIHVACREAGEVEHLVATATRRLEGICRCRIALIVFDSWHAIFRPADEESPTIAWGIWDRLKRLAADYDVTVLVTHHTPKSGVGHRGTQATADASDFILQIDVDRDARTGEFRRRRLRLVRTKHGTPLDLGAFEIEPSPAGAALRWLKAAPPGPERPARAPSLPRKAFGASRPAERLSEAFHAAREAGEVAEMRVSLDVAMRRYLGDRPAPSRARNLRRDVLAAAAKIGVRLIVQSGQEFLEIPEGL